MRPWSSAARVPRASTRAGNEGANECGNGLATAALPIPGVVGRRRRQQTELRETGGGGGHHMAYGGGMRTRSRPALHVEGAPQRVGQSSEGVSRWKVPGTRREHPRTRISADDLRAFFPSGSPFNVASHRTCLPECPAHCPFENVREEEEVHSPERKAVAVTLRRRTASSATEPSSLAMTSTLAIPTLTLT